LLLLSACTFFDGGDYPPLPTVPSVDLQRYLGTWYEIASLPVSQQEGCSCTTAEYSLLEDGVIRVVNSCRKEGPQGKITRAEGKAFVVPNSNNAKLRVQFFWPFRGDYWILELDEEYRYAVVGTPNRKYFWILSRTPRMEATELARLLERVKGLGFDTGKAQTTVHDCW
jgi:apolipoprotein D and lipocalin family protein